MASQNTAAQTASVTRRTLVQLGGAAAAAATVAGLTANRGLAYAAVDAAEADASTPSFLIKPEPITDVAETHDFEIVVVGAGAAGMSAVLTAARGGAKVACMQAEEAPLSQGNMAACLDMERTSPAGRAALISKLIELSSHRANRSLLEAWADNSAAALTQFREAAAEGGIEVNEEEPDADRHLVVNGYDVYLKANTYFGIGHWEVVKAIAPLAEAAGAEFFYSTPAVQIVVDEDGTVTGVVGQREDGSYVQLNASKGVVLATGCYGCNKEMLAYYCPDLLEFPPFMIKKNGDGHKMGVWAGGEIEPIGHTKMVHDARVMRADAPYLLVNYKGERCMAEGPLQGYLNNYVRDYIHQEGDAAAGNLYSVVDAKWQDQAAEWKEWNPEVNIRTCKVYYEGDTIAEACEAAAADGYVLDPAAVEATVARYNELAELGADEDFGKDARYLRAVDEPPFAIIPHEMGYGLSAVLGGLLVNADNQVLKAGEHTPIEGLYAVGNCAGGFYGGIDYPMDVLGLSIGRAITQGYLAGKLLAEM